VPRTDNQNKIEIIVDYYIYIGYNNIGMKKEKEMRMQNIFEERRRIKASLFFYGSAVNPAEGKIRRQVIYKSQGKPTQGFLNCKEWNDDEAGRLAAMKNIYHLNCE
jgi:hypothetical protein